MDISQLKNIELIQSANKEMLDYFNKKFLSDLEDIQSLKTQSFEIDVKIEELEKTKEIYAFKTSSRKSVFSPVITDNTDDERNKIIENQIKDLRDVKSTLGVKIKSLETSLNHLKKRLTTLKEASTAIDAVMNDYNDEFLAEGKDPLEGFEFIEEASSDNVVSHGYNILMQEAFDDTYISTLLDKHVKDGLIGLNHKLDLLSYLLTTDTSRAKLTLSEVKQSSDAILKQVDDIYNMLADNLDTSKPIWSLLDDFVMQIRDNHPECVINASVECTDYEVNLHPVFTINLIKLLSIFFDNIFKHSNANNIDFKISISKNVIDVLLVDNGVGIDPNYLSQSPWYSNLHKAHEVIYLLGGNLNISGDLLSGTKVRFNFPVQG